jgi:prepilin-type N-terminal cleavage/methylation domain-containing protein
MIAEDIIEFQYETEHFLLAIQNNNGLTASRKKLPSPRQKGFTLIELVAALVIISMLAAAFISRYIDLDANARLRAVDSAVAELNGRESLTWSRIKMTPDGWLDDNLQVWEQMDKNLGHYYSWVGSPDPSGGKLRFEESPGILLSRTASTSSQPAIWSK